MSSKWLSFCNDNYHYQGKNYYKIDVDFFLFSSGKIKNEQKYKEKEINRMIHISYNRMSVGASPFLDINMQIAYSETHLYVETSMCIFTYTYRKTKQHFSGYLFDSKIYNID